ncbi:caspase domain-containing protein, partial [Candidatus Latescibacterota bacterium]
QIALIDGDNSIIIQAVDESNNLAVFEQVIELTSDKEPPEIMIILPDSSRGIKPVVSDDLVEVIGLVRDESEITSVSINGELAQLIPPTVDERDLFPGDTVMKFISQIALIDGDNSIIIQAVDESNNLAVFEQVIEKKEESAIAALNMNFHALLIGIDEYDYWPNLSNPVNDIETLARELEKNYGFQTKVLVNTNKNEIVTTIRDYSEKNFPENNELLIVLSGHGHFDDFSKTGYFVPNNGKKPEDDRISESYIAYPLLQNTITNTNCKHVLLVLDACYGGTFNIQIAMRGGENAYRGLTAEEFIARKLEFKTRLLLSSGGKEYVPDGRPGSHSPFMRKFLEALRGYGGTDGILTIEELKENYMNYVDPQPYLTEFQYGNEPGSSFLFIAQ